jgi:hypothetical protein
MTQRNSELDGNSEAFLDRALRRGTAVLFTGAGFSHGAKNIAGVQLPLGSELKEMLWGVAFPGEPLDPRSQLGDVFSAASSARRAETEQCLKEQLTIDPGTIPQWYSNYLEIPWHRVYTLNFDNIFPATLTKYRLDIQLTIISALRANITPATNLSVVHLNGLLGDYPDVTFSPPQYGVRASRPDGAYASLTREMLSHPVIFIGTELDEPPLWQYIALRGDRPSGRELRACRRSQPSTAAE